MVTDRQGQPVNGVPVTFQVAPDWQKNTSLVPGQGQVMTRNGTARIFFDADMPGVVLVTAQVGNTAETRHITVTGSGSRTYARQP